MTSSRRRLGVALLFDPPVAHEIDGLRRAVGDPSLGRIPPHLTLVPPVNVRAGQLPEALLQLRTAASHVPGPLLLTLGPVCTFLPDNPVLYLGVGGDLPTLRTLRDAVFAGPLERTLTWPWVPHVTLAESATPARIAAAVAALDRYAAAAEVDRVVLLEEQRGRIWQPLADATLGPAVVVGRGGLAVEITAGRMLDPEGRRLLEQAAPDQPDLPTGWDSQPPGPPAFSKVVLTARREGEVVGIAGATPFDLGVLVAPGARNQGVGAHLLAHLRVAVRRAGWDLGRIRCRGPAGFYGRYSNSTAE